MFTEIYCIITGRVQRVGYRDFVENLARQHAVVGWVKNCENGSVELLLQGNPDVLKECIEALQTGSVLARVEGMSVDWRSPVESFDDFKVLA